MKTREFSNKNAEQKAGENNQTNICVVKDVLVQTKNVVISVVSTNFTKYFITKLITIILRVTHYNVTEH